MIRPDFRAFRSFCELKRSPAWPFLPSAPVTIDPRSLHVLTSLAFLFRSPPPPKKHLPHQICPFPLLSFTIGPQCSLFRLRSDRKAIGVEAPLISVAFHHSRHLPPLVRSPSCVLNSASVFLLLSRLLCYVIPLLRLSFCPEYLLRL